MFDAFLVPEKTIVTAKGDSAPLDVSAVVPGGDEDEGDDDESGETG